MDCCLLVSGQDMMDFIIFHQLVINIDECPAGIAEDKIDSMFFQTLEKCLCSCEFHAVFLTFKFNASSEGRSDIN